MNGARDRRHGRGLVAIFWITIAAAAAAATGGGGCVCAGNTNGPGDSSSDGGGPGDGGGGVAILALAIEPADPVLVIAGGVAVEQQFTLVATFADGTSGPVDGVWGIGDAALGGIDATGRFLSGTQQGGVTTVTATAGGLTANTSLTLVLQVVVYGPGAPGGSESYFTGAANPDPAAAPVLVYPYDGVMLPPNLAVMDFQWQGGAGNDVWRVHFGNAVTDITVFTIDPSYQPLLTEWLWLAETNRGGDAVTWSVDGASTAGAGWAPGAARTALFAEEDLLGGLYYWSASSGSEGIFRYDFGLPGQAASPFYTQATNGGACVACHALSHDGVRMSFTFDGGDGPFGALDVANPMALTIDRTFASNFQTYGPDGLTMVTTSGGVLTHRDAVSGAALGTLPTGGTSTHPDWSRDGSAIVYTRPGSWAADWIVSGSSLAWMTYTPAGGWGAETLLVSSGGENNYYPGYSPDGAWVLFNRSSGDSYDDPDARVWVVGATGGAPIDCATLNAGGSLTNSWPKWAPFVNAYLGGTLMWTTFSSKRDYGIRLVGAGRAQLWMAAMDPDRAAAGVDPSYPPFWLPFQDMSTQNHIAQWTEEFIKGCMMDEDCGMGWVCNAGTCEPIN